MRRDERIALRINGGAPRPGCRGRSLLSCLHEAGIYPPSACGGRGLCGLCKVKVESGATTPPTEAETRRLTSGELADGFRLSCQLPLTGDLSVTLPESYFKARRHEARLEAVEVLNHDTRRLRLALPEDADFSFTAGQYVRLTVPPHGARAEPAGRSYSLASPPSEKRFVELIVRRVPQGVATTYLHETARVGDTLTLDGPFGDFGLKKTAADAIFVAGGSGIAPFEAILADAAEKKLGKRITFLLGAVRRADFYDLEKIQTLGAALPDFRFIPVLSCPDASDAWDGQKGLVTEALARLFPAFTGMEAYLCGSPGMIEACRRTLADGGMRDGDISYDLFG